MLDITRRGYACAFVTPFARKPYASASTLNSGIRVHRFTLLRVIILFIIVSYSPVWALTRYVDLNSPSPTPPYTNWATAAHVIQDAIDISVNGDTVLVSNGVYDVGGAVRPGYPTLTNRVYINKAIRVMSVNGPLVTSIKGQYDPNTGVSGSNAVRCAYVNSGGSLSGFTLTNGAVNLEPFDINAITGGGLFLENGTASNLVIRNCVSWYGGSGALLNNSSSLLSHSIIRDNSGGGVLFNADATLRNCIVVGNEYVNGGGITIPIAGSIEACTVVSNTATTQGGGIHSVNGSASCRITGTIIYGNSAPFMPQYFVSTNVQITFSCATPLPPGTGNINADPQFADSEFYRLLPSSPCINAGTNLPWMLAAGATDIDGEGRVFDSVADIGADEFWSFKALSLLGQPGAMNIAWYTSSTGTFEVQGSTNLAAHQWVDTGVIVTNIVPYATTTLINASADYEAYRLKRMTP